MQDGTFFRWQERALGVLMTWGAVNVVLGAGAVRTSDDAARQFALQALTWGGIDLALAVSGRRGSRRQDHGAIPETIQRAVQSFRRVLAINALLDVGYIAGGSILTATAGQDRRRIGVGLGIMVQGIFLAVYDAVLLRQAARWIYER